MDCKDAKLESSGKPRCGNSSMTLYVGLYCNKDLCEMVRRGEKKAI
jgi:hypothetical protein